MGDLDGAVAEALGMFRQALLQHIGHEGRDYRADAGDHAEDEADAGAANDRLDAGPDLISPRPKMGQLRLERLDLVLLDGDQVATRLTPRCACSGKSRPEGRITSSQGAPARVRA